MLEENRQVKFLHPEVYKMFEKFTFDRINRGFKHFGSQAILERIRWETSVTEKGGMFKINNNWAALFARMFEIEHPNYAGFFRKRKSGLDRKSS